MRRGWRPKSDLAAVADVAAEWARRNQMRCDTASIFEPDAWRELVGDDLAAAGTPLYLRDGALVVEARDELGATRLRYSAEAIRLVCNERLGTPTVQRVQVR